MASGRILKTQISLSEQVNDLSIHAALLFTWMIPHADDFGRMQGGSRVVKALVVPMRDDFTSSLVDECLNEMNQASLIQRYEIEGFLYIQFPNWEVHQSGLHKRTKSKYPEPEVDCFPGNSGKFPLEQNRTEQEEKRREQEILSAEAQVKNRETADAILSSFGIDGELAVDFKKHRKTKKATITKTAMEGFQREADQAGVSIVDAVRISIERNWQGFKADWIKTPQGQVFDHSGNGASQQRSNLSTKVANTRKACEDWANEQGALT